MYELGQGVEQDNKKALKWYQKSAEQGFDGAKEKYPKLIIKINRKK